MKSAPVSAQKFFSKTRNVAEARAGWLLAGFSTAWFGVLLFSAAQTRQAFVFGDEGGYLLPIIYGANAANYAIWRHLVEYPSHLYFWLYSALPAQGMHDWIKALNAVFIAGTALPSFLVARRYVGAAYALLFACVVVLTPISSFVRYVMPEPVFFFGFWCSLALIVITIDRSIPLSAILGGLSLGLLSLIKPHAFALALGFSVFLILYRPRWQSAAIAALQASTCYLVHVIVKFALTGQWVWSVSTGNYAGLINAQIDWVATLINAGGHTSAICALMALPIAMAINAVRLNVLGKNTDRRQYELALLSLCLLIATVAMTVYFSQKVYQFAPEAERITRLHGRYYVYVLPFVALFSVAAGQRNAFSLPPAFARLCLAISALGAAVIVWRYEVGPVDYPDMTLWGGRSLIRLSYGLVAVQLALFAYCLFVPSTRRIVRIWLAWITAITIGTGILLVVVAPFRSLAPTAIDQVFIAPDATIQGLVGRGDGVIVGTPDSGGDLPRVIFYMRSMSRAQVTGPDSRVTDADLPAGSKWALLLPGVSYAGHYRVTPLGDFKVVWLASDAPPAPKS